jgi:hypothetical protein
MKIYILIVCLLFVSCTSTGKNNVNSSSDSIVNQTEDKGGRDLDEIKYSFKDYFYSEFLLLQAIDNTCPDLSNLESKENNIWNYEQELRNLLKQKPYIVDSLLYELRKRKDFDIQFNKIGIWCDTYIMVSSITARMKDWYISSPEVLYKIPDTKKIIRSFLQIKEQDWGSLSGTQFSELPYKVCN